jgi:hypothetical protein
VEDWPAQDLVDAVYAACCDVKFLKQNFELSKNEEGDQIFNYFGEWPCRINPIATPECGTCDGVEWSSTDPALTAQIQEADGRVSRACTGVWETSQTECDNEQEREILATDPSCLELGTCSGGASTCYFRDFERLCNIDEAMSITKVFESFDKYTMCPTECTDLPVPDGGILVDGVAYSTCDEARAELQARGDLYIQENGGSNDGTTIGGNACTVSGVPFTGAESCCACSSQMGRDFGGEGQGGSWEITLGCVEPAWDTCNPWPQGEEDGGGDGTPECIAACDFDGGNCPVDCDTSACPAEEGVDGPSKAQLDEWLAAGCDEDGGGEGGACEDFDMAAAAETTCKDTNSCSTCHDFNFGDDCASNSREHCAEIDCCAVCETEIRAMWACEHGSVCGGGLTCEGSVEYASPVVDSYAVGAVQGQTTYRLSVQLQNGAVSLHSVYGSVESPMVLPPAFQVNGEFGADVGGVSPELFVASLDSEFDSWLTIGVADGSAPLSVTGIDFASWQQDSGLTADNGMVTHGEKETGGSGGSLEPPAPLPTHLHAVHMAYSECLSTRLSPLAERTRFSQVIQYLIQNLIAIVFPVLN